MINKYADRKMFISKKNLTEFKKQTNKIKNNNFIIENFDLNKQPGNFFLKKKSNNKKLRILSLSNFSYERGVDRILDVAESLYLKKTHNIQFNLLGDYKIRSIKNLFYKKNYNLKHLINKKKLRNIKVLGHKNSIQKYLNQNNLLLYLPRVDSAWGRNIIESLNNGLPVITLGKTNKLIINNNNGFFLKSYNKAKIIEIIENLYGDRKKLFEMCLKSKQFYSHKYNKKQIFLRLENFFNY